MTSLRFVISHPSSHPYFITRSPLSTKYRYGGFAIVGGIAEVLGLLSTGLLLFLLRTQRVTLVLTLVAAFCFAGRFYQKLGVEKKEKLLL